MGSKGMGIERIQVGIFDSDDSASDVETDKATIGIEMGEMSEDELTAARPERDNSSHRRDIHSSQLTSIFNLFISEQNWLFEMMQLVPYRYLTLRVRLT